MVGWARSPKKGYSGKLAFLAAASLIMLVYHLVCLTGVPSGCFHVGRVIWDRPLFLDSLLTDSIKKSDTRHGLPLPGVPLFQRDKTRTGRVSLLQGKAMVCPVFLYAVSPAQ